MRKSTGPSEIHAYIGLGRLELNHLGTRERDGDVRSGIKPSNFHKMKTIRRLKQD